MYRQRLEVEYLPLDARVDVYSAAQRDWVKNIPFNIMEETVCTVMQILVKVVLKVKRREHFHSGCSKEESFTANSHGGGTVHQLKK